MATNSLTIHQAAQIKQEARRGKAGTKWAGKYLRQLNNIGERLLTGHTLTDKDYNTFAVGLVPRAEALIVCSKGFNPIGDNVEASLLIAQTEIPAIKYLITLVDPEPDDEQAQSHLHAEMAIIQYIVKQLGCSKDKLHDWGVEIVCLRKGVCPDCSGWLNQHVVPHSDVRPQVAKLGWSSPLSGAFYKYKGTDLQYNKGQLNTSDTKKFAYTGNAKAVQEWKG